MTNFLALLCAALLLYSAHVDAADPPATTDRIESVKLKVGLADRHYLLFTPGGLQVGSPLLIAFHPSDSTGTGMRRMTGAALERIARARGFAIAYPDGFEGHFNDCRRAASYSARTKNIDDVGLSRAIVRDVAGREAIDARRVYALGYSNGAQMALRLAIETPDLVAGVVAISGNVPVPDNSDCEIKSGRPVSVVLIEGTSDPINPYAGGNVSFRGTGNRGNVMSALASAQWFASRYGIAEQRDAPAPITAGGLTARWQDWGTKQPIVRLISVEGGGHTIPQADFDFGSSYVGSAFRSDSLLESALDAISSAPNSETGPLH
jgi:polyhydroxybutyrate depolymerase